MFYEQMRFNLEEGCLTLRSLNSSCLMMTAASRLDEFEDESAFETVFKRLREGNQYKWLLASDDPREAKNALKESACLGTTYYMTPRWALNDRNVDPIIGSVRRICCEFEHYNLIVIKVIRVDLRYVQLGRSAINNLYRALEYIHRICKAMLKYGFKPSGIVITISGNRPRNTDQTSSNFACNAARSSWAQVDKIKDLRHTKTHRTVKHFLGLGITPEVLENQFGGPRQNDEGSRNVHRLLMTSKKWQPVRVAKIAPDAHTKNAKQERDVGVTCMSARISARLQYTRSRKHKPAYRSILHIASLEAAKA
ncbi:hypothetical protein FIBSPDRAFT_899111 [Athelia psychrophila]|uniref:Uncharacterized protein n=1 Tax=Athelia psychrophila TaxID=1759441 RepID=A0A166A353_9AGAM|nr:hypothetical protein FIBSPDRAFT_899111 [Fibularhizoctonia sp. CBS 109695]